MKATGIVRKIDHLGRIVVPMEIRRAQNWPEGTSMEMFMSEAGMVLRKYQSPVDNQGEVLKELKALLHMNANPKASESIRKAIAFIEQK